MESIDGFGGFWFFKTEVIILLIIQICLELFKELDCVVIVLTNQN